jgi:8-oxo-dGTP pyrophosphatase MutT (NUDIX family)
VSEAHTEMRAATRDLVAAIDPLDDTEVRHRAQVLDWIDSGEPLWRTAKPTTPAMHLVSYAVVIDPALEHALLVDHRIAGLWLPTGGHIEPGEHPTTTARRELAEELGIHPATHRAFGDRPVLVTVTETVGDVTTHHDVSLWYAFTTPTDTDIQPDPVEFADTRWWPIEQITHRHGTRFDPHLPRFLAKLVGIDDLPS